MLSNQASMNTFRSIKQYVLCDKTDVWLAVICLNLVVYYPGLHETESNVEVLLDWTPLMENVGSKKKV